MVKFRHLAIGTALGFAMLNVAPVAAQSQSSGSAAAASEGDEDPMICRKTRPTGSRVATKVCRTKSQWAAIERAARESANTIQGAGAVNTTPTVGG